MKTRVIVLLLAFIMAAFACCRTERLKVILRVTNPLNSLPYEN
jgi:hypothetical protein